MSFTYTKTGGNGPPLPPKTMFLGFFRHDTQHHYPQISGLDGLSSIKMTANKYNIRAKRLALDNLIRDREWKAFLISFSQLSSAQGGGGIPIIPGGGGGSGGNEDEEERRPGESTVSLCKAVVICRHHLTAHRTLLHSLCDVPRDTPRPPPPRRWFVSWRRPVPDRCSFASPGDREQRHSTW